MFQMFQALRELAEGFIFDPSLIDLVVWFPHLSWSEFGASLATVLAWRWLTDRVERALVTRARRVTARVLLRLALLMRPRPGEA